MPAQHLIKYAIIFDSVRTGNSIDSFRLIILSDDAKLDRIVNMPEGRVIMNNNYNY